MHPVLPIASVIAVALTACAAAPAPAPATAPPLAAYFDCLRTENQTVVSAHRAGPAPGLPENALATMAATLDRNPHALLEIDVRRSADGMLYLFHDDRLERLSTGRGSGADLRWRALSRLRLRDDAGAVTAHRIPRLADALALAIRRQAIVQLDVKRGVPFAAVVDAVRAAGATRHVVIITYTDRDAAEVARLAPELMVSVGIDGGDDLARLNASGVPTRQMLAWTGTRAPDSSLFAALRRDGIGPIFGTLGRPGERLDDRWLDDGDASEFVALARSGAVVIATDRAAEIEPVLPPVSCRAH